jgi:protein-S-isoprenylcysteine O-methyltransferase Ste14
MRTKDPQDHARLKGRMDRFTDFPLQVFLLSLVVLWLCALLGARLRRSLEEHGEKEPETFTIVLTASLTLLGLIMGFTFSMAINRYEQRKAYEAEEANAIGTEYVRAGLLPPSDAAMTRLLLKSYVDQRVLFFNTRDPDRLKQIEQRTTQLQGQLWSTVQKAALAQPNVLTSLAAAGMNDVLNAQGYTQAAWWNRIPWAAWVLLVVIAMLCNVMVGFASKGATARSPLLVILPLLVAITLLLIADIDSPRGGKVRVSAQNLESLSTELH